MLPPGFYNQVDKDIYSAGDFFIPQERFRAAPYTVNQPTNPDEVPAGIPTVYQPQGGGGGGGYTGGISDLTGDFFKTTSDRQNRLIELNRPLQAAQFPSFPGPKTPGGLNAQQMYNIASEDLNNPFNRSAMSTTFPTRTAKEVMDYADNAIQDYRMQYATGQLGPSFIEAEKPTLNRRINDAFYSLPFLSKPQSAEMILNEGYDKPYGSGGPGILGLLSKMDNYHNLSRPDQAFIAANMGYTGPTVFGENTSGLSKDPFGLNVRSAFGNYAERVGVESEKLGDLLGGKLSEKYGATFNPETGMFESEDEAAAAKANKMTKMLRAKFNFYTKQNMDYADMVKKAAELQGIKDTETAKDFMAKNPNYGDNYQASKDHSGDGGYGHTASSPGATTGSAARSRHSRSSDLGFSDIRLKENVELIGKSPSNINIYSFNYLNNPTKYQGVMAHEVPWASKKHDSGYLMVDYNKVDVDFKKHIDYRRKRL